MSRFCSLFSSSKGNSHYLSSGGTSLLIDAGVSVRTLLSALSQRGIGIGDIDAVLVTHEHTDHIRGLRTLLRRYPLSVYASPGTLEYLCVAGHIPPGTNLVACEDVPVQIGDIAVTAFPIPHDAIEPVGYRFSLPDQKEVAVATDLGHITERVREEITGCELVLLESNYDKRMLECSRYPYSIKRRIKGLLGHLSNDDCAREAVRLVQAGTTRLVLGHLSENNNLPQIAYETGKTLLGAADMREDYDYILRVAPARGPQELTFF